MHKPVTPGVVQEIAAFAALPLSTGRHSAVAPVLDAWLRDANALSAKMSEPAYRGLVPATVFSHPAVPEGEA